MAIDPHTTLTFLGAAGTVTGSKYLLSFGGRRLLVDAGMFQGEKQWRLKNWDAFPVPPSSISDIVLTHAHMDHSGYLPALVKHGFKGTIWCTDGTRRLTEIILRDSAHLQEVEAQEANEGGYSRHTPAVALYTTEDVERTLPRFRVIDFDEDVDLGAGVTAVFTRAAHILGSASVLVRCGAESVLFSGDLGRHDHPVLRPRATPPSAPFVVIESTYGDREHPEPADLDHEPLADAVRRTIARGGSVLIPAFAIDRTELVLKTLTEMRRAGRIPEVPIWVNSPMALSALDAYRASPGELRPDVSIDDFADLPNLREARSQDESVALTGTKDMPPSIIIASSGMATGGRVVHHLASMLPDKKNSIVLTGYQAVGTRGRRLIEGEKQLKMFGRYVPVRAEVVADHEFSVHGDASDLIDWLRDLSPAPQTVFVTHGEEGSSAALSERIRRELGLMTVIPEYQEVVSLAPTSLHEVPVLVAPFPDVPIPDAPVAAAVAAPAAPATLAPAALAAVAWDRGDGSRAGAVVAGSGPAVTAVPAAMAAPGASGRLRYRCLTGPDDAEFCKRVSQALEEGYVLQGGPALTFDGVRVMVAQAVVLP